jgi:putative thioredoxin
VGLSEHIQDVNESTFEQDVLLRSHEVPVVVDFWAPWCGPCRSLGPLLERLAIEGGGSFLLARVNVDDNPSLAVRYGVQGIPAVKGFRNGEVSGEFVGAQPEPVVRRFLEKLAPGQVQQQLQEAAVLLGTRHWPEAERAYRSALMDAEGSAPAALGLLKCLIMQGRGGEALDVLSEFPPGTEWAEAEKLRPLAQLLAQVEGNGERPQDDPLAAQLYQSARLLSKGNLEAAMDGMLDILRQDKNYRKGLPKSILLAIFALLGDNDSLTRLYREELASILF